MPVNVNIRVTNPAQIPDPWDVSLDTIIEFKGIVYENVRGVMWAPRRGYAVSNPNVKTLRPFGKTDTSAGVLGWTGHITLLSPIPFHGIRFNCVNAGAVDIVNTKMAFALPATNPTPCITTASWAPITAGGASTITWTKPTNVEQPFITKSDIIPCTAVKRTDGPGYLIMIRAEIPSAGNTVGPRTSGTTDLAAADSLDKLGLQVGYFNGAGVTTPGSFVRGSAALGCPVYVELFSADTQTPVLLAAGDSIVGGQGGGDAGAPTAHQRGAYKRTVVSKNWVGMCAAISGQKSADYIQQAIDKYLTSTRARYGVIPPWSINDGDALVAGVEARILCNMVRWQDACAAVGTEPVFLTPAPRNGITSAQEAVRRSVVATIKAYCADNGIKIIDRDAIWTDYSTATGGYKAGLFADDLHPNEAGYELEAPLWIETLV